MTIKGPLAYLFGHQKLKLLKFLIHNRNHYFSIAELSEKTQIPSNELRKELRKACKHGILQEEKKNKMLHYKLREVEEIHVLEEIIFKLGEEFFDQVYKKVSSLGDVQLCIVQGIFMQREHDRVDLFMVMDDQDEKKFEKFVQDLESELGTEVRYSVMSTEDFRYRVDMFDKFVLSILEDNRNKVLVDKLCILDNNV